MKHGKKDRRPWVPFLLALLFLTRGFPALAWGPHSQITQAALEAVGPDGPLVRHLGLETKRLTAYCWLADWQRGLLMPEGREWFYPDDCLLFPAMPRHLSHACPGVQGTYRPYFQRVVQALGSETPANAARWLGALIHFAEDSGSPPHAIGIQGDVHTKMENWVVANRITLDGYRPRLLGGSEAEALAGFEKRMDGLIAYSKERGLRLRPLVEKGERAKVEPVVLECALECSRVVADLLHTLGHISFRPRKGTATLRGTIAAEDGARALEKVPAKIVLEGTGFSTLADAAGVYEFHNLPAGAYRVTVCRPGCETATVPVKLAAGGTCRQDLALPKADPPGNLVRNADFRLRWVRPDIPDGWYKKWTRQKKVVWEGELLPVQAGQRYRLEVRWKNAQGDVVLFWGITAAAMRENVPGYKRFFYYVPKEPEKPLTPRETARIVTAPAEARYAMIVFRTSGPPNTVCERVALVPEP